MAVHRQSVDHTQREGEKYSLERTSISSDSPLHKDDEDVEAQMVTPAQPPPAQPLEYSTSTTKKLVFLGLYFFLSLGLTLSNKALMKTVSVSLLHTLSINSANRSHRRNSHGCSQCYTPDLLSLDAACSWPLDSLSSRG